MTVFVTVILTLSLAPALLLFIDGFMNSQKVDTTTKNKGMTAFLTLVGKVYFPINRLGAWLRRALGGVRRA